MADLSINTANVAPNGCNINKDYLSGAAIAPGKCVYLDTTVSPNNWKLARANAVATCSGMVGIAMNSTSAAGQPLDVAVGGSPATGANPMGAATVEYVVSATAPGGLIALTSDLVSTNILLVLGVSDGSGHLVMPPNGSWVTGLAKP